MKSYRQYCSVARALDVVGDRWVLLIVRELLALGPSRYTDLRRGLPGIATNLLADRLKAMEADGLIERYDAPPPVGTTLFRLTGRGRELQGVVQALARWGMASMPSGPDAQDAVQPHWSALAWVLLPGRPSPDAEVVVGIASEGETLCVVLRPAERLRDPPRGRSGRGRHPHAAPRCSSARCCPDCWARRRRRASAW